MENLYSIGIVFTIAVGFVFVATISLHDGFIYSCAYIFDEEIDYQKLWSLKFGNSHIEVIPMAILITLVGAVAWPVGLPLLCIYGLLRVLRRIVRYGKVHLEEHVKEMHIK